MAVDSRTNEQFDEAHIPGAISASAYDTGFATKVAQVVPADAELIVVAASDGNELEAAELLAAVGLRGARLPRRRDDRLAGGGAPGQRIEPIDPDELAARLDGRRPAAGRSTSATPASSPAGHIPGSVHIPYGELRERLDELPRDRPIATICRAANAAASPPRSCSARASSGSSTSRAAACPPGARSAASSRPPRRRRPRRASVAGRVAGDEAFGRVDRRGVPARAGAADGVEGEAGDDHPGVAGVGVDGDPLAGARFAPGLEAGRVERA